MLHGLTCALLCFSFIFADITRCKFAVVLHAGFSMFVLGIVRTFHCDWSDHSGPSHSVLIFKMKKKLKIIAFELFIVTGVIAVVLLIVFLF